jgi:putative colanic acid biosynthesis acetyltransferase WcaF
MTILDARKSRPMEGGPSFTLRNRLFRVIWQTTWILLASWTPPSFYPWRSTLLRLFGARIAKSAQVRASVRVWYPPNLIMDDQATLGPRVNCYNMATIRIKIGAIVSQGAHLCAGSHDVDHPHLQLTAAPIIIGPKAWIAAEAFVGPGVTVSEGAVLGARGVAFRDLDVWTVYIGNPARPLRKRVRWP